MPTLKLPCRQLLASVGRSSRAINGRTGSTRQLSPHILSHCCLQNSRLGRSSGQHSVTVQKHKASYLLIVFLFQPKGCTFLDQLRIYTSKGPAIAELMCYLPRYFSLLTISKIDANSCFAVAQGVITLVYSAISVCHYP